ncbi:uncharacterized protein LOC122818653 [Drosophila biarmipes]|uniref:uncharacterized protein LOC122818653 n=1 Tax=Drosophila biarmipes TaxID=125945 RepID=UPI001CDAB6D6|nr:uncharacterized protein LOC122818653 [Drosophila biarmipes]XP_050740662.1 uncharacterized protein LOC122818653 [Drosophila biarmipes]
MPSPGEAELPKICCSECLAQIKAALQIHQGTPMTPEESPNETPLADDNVITVMGLEDNIDEDQELSDDSIIVIMGLDEDINEDQEASSQGDDNNAFPEEPPKEI